MDTLKEGEKVKVEAVYSGGWLIGDSEVSDKDGTLGFECQHGWQPLSFYDNNIFFRISKL